MTYLFFIYCKAIFYLKNAYYVFISLSLNAVHMYKTISEYYEFVNSYCYFNLIIYRSNKLRSNMSILIFIHISRVLFTKISNCKICNCNYIKVANIAIIWNIKWRIKWIQRKHSTKSHFYINISYRLQKIYAHKNSTNFVLSESN